ncbi:MAG TPA: DUF2304 domain-containing protein [Patescibacteria group bacterium]|nr:DUF2304 domain-containing protein [Patescibacteria group bacterium]
MFLIFKTHQIFGFVVSLLFLILIIEMVRRRKLLEGYSLLWIFTGLILVVISLWEKLWIKIASLLGIVYAPFSLLIFFSLFLIIVCLDFSMKISKSSQQIKGLIQKVALLENKVEKCQKKSSKSKK